MRNLLFCAIKDLAVGAFMAPGPQQSTGAAVRMFTDMINDPQSEISKHPEDYELYQLSPWDDETGVFLPVSELPEAEGKFGNWIDPEAFLPRLLVRGKDVVKPRQ